MELIILLLIICLIFFFLKKKLIFAEKQKVENQTFNVSFAIYTLMLFLVAGGIYYFAPYYLTLWLSDSYIKDCGQIGDAIGGTAGPLIAILASFLTFLAFWIQYKANEQQRNDISLERFEGQFYEMLRLHRENLFDLSCNKYKGRDAMVSYCFKLKFIYTLVHYFCRISLEEEVSLLLQKYCADNYDTNVDKGLSAISFNLFLYGGTFSYTFAAESDERKLYDLIIKAIVDFELRCTIYKADVIYSHEMVTDNLDDILTSYLGGEFDDDTDQKLEIADALLCGYNEKLGVYYRQLFQLVQFVSQRVGLRENERYSYIKIVRSQLSDYEQILLYYNSLTKIGDKWNHVHNTSNVEIENKWLAEMKLIARFRLIKNIPASFAMFGWVPESEYELEISTYNANQISFFESK